MPPPAARCCDQRRTKRRRRPARGGAVAAAVGGQHATCRGARCSARGIRWRGGTHNRWAARQGQALPAAGAAGSQLSCVHANHHQSRRPAALAKKAAAGGRASKRRSRLGPARGRGRVQQGQRRPAAAARGAAAALDSPTAWRRAPQKQRSRLAPHSVGAAVQGSVAPGARGPLKERRGGNGAQEGALPDKGGPGGWRASRAAARGTHIESTRAAGPAGGRGGGSSQPRSTPGSPPSAPRPASRHEEGRKGAANGSLAAAQRTPGGALSTLRVVPRTRGVLLREPLNAAAAAALFFCWTCAPKHTAPPQPPSAGLRATQWRGPCGKAAAAAHGRQALWQAAAVSPPLVALCASSAKRRLPLSSLPCGRAGVARRGAARACVALSPVCNRGWR